MGKKSREKRERDKRSPAVPRKNDSLPLWLFLLIAGVAFLAYAHTLRFDFVFDDDVQILRNPWIRDWSKVGQFFTTDVWRFENPSKITNYYRPLHMVAHAVGYTFSGLTPLGYHLLNILIHCACTVLVAAIGFRLSRDKLIGVAGALIFALHPVHAESVAWIAGITDPLCAAFYFGALLSHLEDDSDTNRRGRWIFTALLFLGALLSKEMAFTFPFVALWMDWCAQRKVRWSRYAVMAGMFGIYALLRISALGRFMVQPEATNLNLHDRVLSSVVLVADYTLKMFVPYDINAYHVFQPATGITEARFMLGCLTLLLFGTVAFWMRGDRCASFASGFCIVTLMPLLGTVGVGATVMADRYLYIPSLGACLLIPLLGRKIWMIRPTQVKWPGIKAAAVSLSLLLAVFGWIHWNTSSMWRDNVTLYSETVKRSPTADLMLNNLGRYYFYSGDTDRAEEYFLRAKEAWGKTFFKRQQNLADVYNGLGGVYFKRGSFELAREYFQKVNELTPRDFKVLQNLGSVCLAMQDYKGALQFYAAALEINPENEVTYNNMAAIYLTAKDYEKAIVQAKKALEIFPKYGDAYMNLGRAYAAQGMNEEARRAYLSARQVDPAKATVVEEELKTLKTSTPSK